MQYGAATPECRTTSLGWLAALALLVLLLAAYKLLPGQLPNAQSMIGDAAYAQCLYDTRAAGSHGCLGIGYPAGSPKPFGLPVSLLAWTIFGGDGEISPGEVRTIYAGVISLAFAMACLLFRRITGSWPLGLLGAVLYLFAPVIQQQSGFAALQLGLALIPAYLLLDIALLDAFGRRRALRVVQLVVLVAGVRVFALFLDGYSFLFSCALTAIVFAMAAVARRRAPVPALAALATHAVCSGLAAWIYRQYMPAGLGVMPLEFFRGAGVDVLTMLLPMQWQGLYGLFGFGLDVQPEMSYGGRASLLGVFVGYASLMAAGVLAWAAATRRAGKPGALTWGILLAGGLAVLLSLGPSLKFDDFRDNRTRESALDFAAYLMPEAAASLPLHTGWIYRSVPGIRNARVLARWQVLARLALVVVTLLALRALWRSGYRWQACLLGLFAVFEVVPDPSQVVRESEGAIARADLVYRVQGGEFASRVRPGEKVLLLQLHAGASGNEFAANTLCARARAHCYNAGGDKASIVVRSEWPEEIRRIRRGKEKKRQVAAAFEAGVVDVVVVPHFDLRRVVYPWSPLDVDVADTRARAQALAGGRLQVEHGEHFTFLRQAP